MSAAGRRRPRVFIGLREVAGFGRGLKAGFDQLGVEAAFLNIGYHDHHYEVSGNPAWATRLSRASENIGRHFTGAWWKRILWIGFVQNVFSLLALPRAVARYDAFIFLSVASFGFFLELPLLKLLGKKVVFIFLGSDARPVYLNGYVMSETTRGAVWKAIALARIQKTLLWIIDRFADVVVNIPPQAHFHTRPYVNGYQVGIPAEYATASRGPCPPPERVRILHAPSKTGPKGTPRIREIVQALREKGLDFDYVEITGRPHAEVLFEIQDASFVIDELYSDTPLAGFSTEAAFFGRPSVVGSYYARDIGEVLDPVDTPPSAFCHPDDVQAVVERLILDRAYREDLGRRAHDFVHARWAARRVAEKYLALIEGTAPPGWLLDPATIRYVHGVGLSESRGAEVLREFIRAGGKRALCLGDKPELAALLMQRSMRGG